MYRVGYKCNLDGDYVNIELVNKTKEAQQNIALQKQMLASQQSIEQLTGVSAITGEVLECDEDDDECIALGSDFIRSKKESRGA